MPEELIGTPEIAEMLGVSIQRVHQLMDTDLTFPAPVRKFGRQRVWRRSDIEAWVKQRRGKQDG